LRYRLEYRNIRRYVGEHELSVLDAGGGNTASAIQFAREGHLVTVVDSSEAMLTDGREAAQKAGLDDMKYTKWPFGSSILRKRSYSLTPISLGRHFSMFRCEAFRKPN